MKASLAVVLMLTVGIVFGQSTDTRYYELRIYYATAGKLDVLIQRFQNHTTKIFERHGMTNIGYWVPVENDKNSLYYILSYPDKESRDKSWAAFSSDPEWKEVSAKTGKIVDSVKSVFLKASELGPFQYANGSTDRVFEMRTYYCNPGKLPTLTTRFRDHTLKIFESHGMKNVAYYNTVEADGSQPKLLYFLAHESVEAAKKSWADFIADPKWIAARDASEKDGKILEKLTSVYLRPLPFSKIK